MARALSSKVRLDIINLLNTKNVNIHELAESLKIPVSTAASHIKVLEESGLILTELRPAVRGSMRVCTRNFDDIHIQLNDPKDHLTDFESVEIEMPIGQYVDYEAAPTCGMANHEGLLIPEDQPGYFYSPNRTNAQLIWTRKGYFEYKLPLVVPHDKMVESLELSLELCSEAPNFDPNWPSDITVWLNSVDIGTWTSPGDFGDRPGKLNPKSWADTVYTQYGTLKTWKVTREKTAIDAFYLSDVTIDDLHLKDHDFLSFKIGIKDDALHKGGINLFGKDFGDHPQDIKLKVNFS
ncbi:ArsR family transcriptional regulator [Jeotgalibacillus proteolyticus]|uniref:ArsR family transcriptional regulator n=2 Tax=Jeotgalibacillus proteolyticus TaxID=2082395 RepID=A0A2S5G897_9BACL|nr:ArsR family transcriptional regulator [Jeotgalibacillus proteolyticus]